MKTLHSMSPLCRPRDVRIYCDRKQRRVPQFWSADAMPHSCVLHEHLVHVKEQCRKRIRDHSHIFAALIDTCTQNVLGMAQERDGE
jgi:hypothetical protein